MRTIDCVGLAHTIAHEFAHNKGLQHRDMLRTTRYGYISGWRERYAYAQEFLIEQKPVVVVRRDEQLLRRRQAALSKAQAKVTEWKTAAKRSQTMLVKWQRRLRAAEKKLTPTELIPPSS